MMKLKFPGFITEETAFLAGQVRFGEINRKEALEIENKELVKGKKPETLDFFLKELGMNEDEFEFYASDWRKVNKYYSKSKTSLMSLYHRLRKG